jgi:hypothetical protein
VKFTPSPITAALAGLFSAIAWPLLWARFGGAQSAGTVEVVVITLLAIALPAHAFVVGFGPAPVTQARSLDTALLKRIAAWLAAAGAAAALQLALR